MEEVKVKKQRKKKSPANVAADIAIEKELEQKQLTPQEQAEMLRNYVASMEKTQGHSDENVRDIIDAVYRRFLLILNYSSLSKQPEMKEIKANLKSIYEDEMTRYSGEDK